MAEVASDDTVLLASRAAAVAAAPASLARRAFATLHTALNSLALALATVVLMEWLARGSLADVDTFLFSSSRPGMAAVALFFLLYIGIDALLGRAHQSALVLLPVALVPAFMSAQKQLFLSDPLYPSDLLFGRQIVELLPAMVAARPLDATLYALATLSAVGVMAYLWLFARRSFTTVTTTGKLVRLAVALPLIAMFVPLMDYARYSPMRDRLNIIPKMWDQQANYRHNGFLFAFAFNVPMANVAAPAGYGREALAGVQPSLGRGTGYPPTRKPDIIMVMSESLWDPTRLPAVTLSPDPMPVIRANQSGAIFSPEFGGMTANVEFEALTGFSNAFLPTGSIPYQQYLRRPIPSLATFFRDHGYRSLAFHPFEGWFWNRNNVYEALGFDDFLSQEKLPEMDKRGIFASDEALTREIIRAGDETSDPFFFFAVTLQGHGPYEANRYKQNTIDVRAPSLSARSTAALATFAQGLRESDQSLKALMDWAKKRDRETIIVLWGDHLPPLGTVYPESGFMATQVASRTAGPEQMALEHETPLVIWSSRRGAQTGAGSISPSQLPYHVLKLAGFSHPFYTGLLGEVQDRFAVVDRHMLIDRNGKGHPDWLGATVKDPVIRDYRLVQYDVMFGEGFARDRLFPDAAHHAAGS